ncbi:hypothetical protein SADUNF_Sadunf08G0054000 [Salix dunnii]|uniref:Uncharacterized protein n=1 Tax=Salix dunnii TaxID=1413687 RepID=A0A835MTF2_9ROSI|nr:hypothetical protein SADUNF_Sadunf08G0054000 [Salix dunnii]
MGFAKEEKSKRVLRGVKTLFFLIVMLISFLLFSAPILLVIADTLLPFSLLSASLSPSLSLETLSSHFSNYDFRYSLVDIPLISIIRSAVIICVYSLCDGPGLSRGPYLGITTTCSVSSLIYVSFKAPRVFRVSRMDQGEHVIAMEIALFICSLLLAIGHVAVAYRTSCRERRKLLVYKIDIEAVIFISYLSHPIIRTSEGPLRKAHRRRDDEYPAASVAECEGSAMSFIYDLATKDSILVTARSGGHLQIDALADEIQSVRMVGSPRLHVNSHDHIISLAMLCESISVELPVVKLDQPHDNIVWFGHPPPLLRLAIVDLSLQRKTETRPYISMFADPIMPERIYSVHNGGIDSIVLRFLPFTGECGGKDEIVRTPSAHPILSTCQGSPNLRSVAADSIEGQSTLHQHLNLFHENYVEYAHKVYFELKHHGPHLKRIIDDQHARLDEAQEKFSKVRKKQSGFQHNLLERRLHCLKNLAGAHKKPLSKAEREFKSETRVELESLRTSIDTLRARPRMLDQSSKGDVANQQTKKVRRNYVLYAQISQLKSSIAELSLLNKLVIAAGKFHLGLKYGMRGLHVI